jgi:hypothetical protein
MELLAGRLHPLLQTAPALKSPQAALPAGFAAVSAAGPKLT